MAESDNPLVLTGPSDSNLQIALHPLVLLTISDHITRHQIRKDADVIVGALLGQIHGRSMTIEHAFPCEIIRQEPNVILHTNWFEDRLKQYKDVHKQPPLDLVGWFTVTPESGPTIAQLQIHQQILGYHENPVFLAFHSSALASMSSNTTGKLPLTLYETIEDVEAKGQANNSGKHADSSAMQLDGDESSLPFRFRAVPYSIETEETEMIGIDYIAKGGGNASAIDAALSPEISGGGSSRRGKRRSKQAEERQNTEEHPETSEFPTALSAEEEDLIATLTTRLNSIRMLQSRIQLLQKFLSSQPPSYLSEATAQISGTSPAPNTLPCLRQINALITQLSLLTPPPVVTEEEMPTSQAEVNLTALSNDASISTLLSLLGQNVQGVNELGRKFAAAEQVRSNHRSSGGKMLGGRGGIGLHQFDPGLEGDFEGV